MTNKDKLKELFGIEEVLMHCSCTRDEVQDRCIENGKCLGCEKWLNKEYETQKKGNKQ